MIGLSPLVKAEHTHSTGDFRLTMTHKHGFFVVCFPPPPLSPFPPSSHPCPFRPLPKTASFPRCYGSESPVRRRICGHIRTECEWRFPGQESPPTMRSWNRLTERFGQNV